MIRICYLVLGFLSATFLHSCGTPVGDAAGTPIGGSNGNAGSTDSGNGGDSGAVGDDTSGSSAQRPSRTDGDSVADVTTGDNSSGSGQSQAPSGVSARVRNESTFSADVFMRFVADDTVVHLAFVRALPGTVTTVVSPRRADLIEMSGQDDGGRALERKTLRLGIDFDVGRPGEYVISPADSDPPDNPPVDPTPPGITMLAPAGDVALALGATLLVKWEDSTPGTGAVVQLFLRPEGSVDRAEWVALGPGVDAALDGLNDQLVVVLEGVASGTYEIVGEISRGDDVATSVAPGRVEVIADPANMPPVLSIVSPTALVEIANGESLLIEWTDDDPDNNAVITFSLAGAAGSGTPGGTFPISPPIAEDPDGNSADSATLTVSGVLPGLYDLVGTISDGELVGTDRVEGVVRVLAEATNDAPQITLLEPASDIEVGHGESFLVRWSDSDANDNARISLTLDPFPAVGAPDRSPALLVSSLAEDAEQAGDEILIGIPTQVAKGSYRVKGEITDGISTAVSWAPGIVYFGVSTASSPQLTLSAPSTDVRTRLGETVDVRAEAPVIPSGGRVRLYLSNINFGGVTRSEITPPVLNIGDVTTLALSDSPGAIPNDAWPRQFELVGELTVDGAVVTSDTAPGTVWIRQEVVVKSISVNYTCPAPVSPNEREVSGLEIQWYGGGYTERDAHADVEFWLLPDADDAPPSASGDRQHRLIHTASESPNLLRIVQLPLQRIFLIPVRIEDGLGSTMVPDDYYLRTRVQSSEFGAIVSPAFQDDGEDHPFPIPICGLVR